MVALDSNGPDPWRVPTPLDVLCVGHAAFDLTMTVERHPGPDEKCSATSMVSSGGGPAANASVAVTRLGGRSAFVGYLGTDPFGELHVAELLREHVAVTGVARGRYPTPFSIVLVKPDGARTVVNHKAQTPGLSPEQADLARFAPKVILMDGHEPEMGEAILRHAAKLGARTVLDAGSVRRGTLDLLGAVDFVIASTRFAVDFAADRDPLAALTVLSRHARWAAVTLGEAGIAWVENSRIQTVGAHRVEVVDTTGAGDVLHGAFALAIARGAPPSRALRFGNAAAALACTRLGARPGIPTAAEVVALLAR